MTLTTSPTPRLLDAELLTDLRAHAGALDHGDASSRRSFEDLGAAGHLALGAPGNADGRLPEMAEVVREIAEVCMSTAFSVWAHRMVVEYLLTADTPFATTAVEPLLTGTVLGVTGMAPAFKDLAGCGTIEVTAAPVDGGYELSGPLRWASNLHPDATLVTAARTEAGERLIVALPLSTPGVQVGEHFDLLAMGSTASSSLRFHGARVPRDQVLSHDFESFLAAVRPTFLLLQTAMCLGLARTGIDQARAQLAGVNAVFATEADRAAADLARAEATLTELATTVGGHSAPGKKDLLSLRLAAAELATAATALEIRTAGGKGYAGSTPANRRYREAAFIPLQSPSEAQLRWELATHA
ncbi:acyl-CoA dehydrogenase family protein [Streptomyces sp. HSW2009]|uniref:acyl-CoA dehydrogenase family protein n=1 Tax=Streptomyces sp. HSW2009 TaxID=3142890 RepID=UPI0032EF49B1